MIQSKSLTHAPEKELDLSSSRTPASLLWNVCVKRPLHLRMFGSGARFRQTAWPRNTHGNHQQHATQGFTRPHGVPESKRWQYHLTYGGPNIRVSPAEKRGASVREYFRRQRFELPGRSDSSKQ